MPLPLVCSFDNAALVLFLPLDQMLKSLIQITAGSSSCVIVHLTDSSILFNLIASAYSLKLTVSSRPIWIYLDTGILDFSSLSHGDSTSSQSPVLLIRQIPSSFQQTIYQSNLLFHTIHWINSNFTHQAFTNVSCDSSSLQVDRSRQSLALKK